MAEPIRLLTPALNPATPQTLGPGISLILPSLPSSVRQFLQQKIRFQNVSGVTLPAVFVPPDLISVSETEDDETRMATSVYQAVGQALARELDLESGFDAKYFLNNFATQALRHFRGQEPYRLSVTMPSPTAIFLEKIWTADDIDLHSLWQESIVDANRRDPYKFLRYGGQMILNQQPVKSVMSRAQEAVRILNRYQWEVNVTAKGEADPLSLRDRTTLRFEGIWKTFGVGPITTGLGEFTLAPGAEVQVRVGSPVTQSDLLWLGGLHATLTHGTDEYCLEAHAGYSGQNVITFEDPIPGGEVLLGFNHRENDTHFWQLVGGVSYGLNVAGDARALVAGVYLRRVE